MRRRRRAAARNVETAESSPAPRRCPCRRPYPRGSPSLARSARPWPSNRLHDRPILHRPRRRSRQQRRVQKIIPRRHQRDVVRPARVEALHERNRPPSAPQHHHPSLPRRRRRHRRRADAVRDHRLRPHAPPRPAGTAPAATGARRGGQPAAAIAADAGGARLTAAAAGSGRGRGPGTGGGGRGAAGRRGVARGAGGVRRGAAPSLSAAAYARCVVAHAR